MEIFSTVWSSKIRPLMLIVAIGTLAVAPTWADEDGDKRETRVIVVDGDASPSDEASDDSGESKSSFDVKVIKVIKVDDSGNIQLDTDNLDLPADVRKRIDEALKSGGAKIETRLSQTSKSKDGESPQAERSGRITIVGSDGKEKTFKFGSAMAPADMQQFLEQSLNNKAMSEEVRKQLRQAVEGLDADLREMQFPRSLRFRLGQDAMQLRSSNNADRDLDAKLDKIMERLDAIEKKLDRMQSK